MNCTPCEAEFFAATARIGVVVIGMCEGMEMVLRANYVIKRYIHIDTDPAAKDIMRHRLMLVTMRHPRQLSEAMAAGAWDYVTNDLLEITPGELSRSIPRGTPVLVVYGFSCVNLNPAGGMRGLQGTRSELVHRAVALTSHLQRRSSARSRLSLRTSPHSTTTSRTTSDG